jgi:hypothetical protein
MPGGITSFVQKTAICTKMPPNSGFEFVRTIRTNFADCGQRSHRAWLADQHTPPLVALRRESAEAPLAARRLQFGFRTLSPPL